MRTTSDFIAAATAKHGDLYDYSRVRYVNARTKVEIICREHGPFWQLPRKHVARNSCPSCSRLSGDSRKRTTVDEFVRRSKLVHRDRYDYSLVTDIPRQLAKVVIVCRLHGRYEQVAASHLRGHGCKLCSLASVTSGKSLKSLTPAEPRYTTDLFKERAVAVHGSAYDYSLVDYTGGHVPVTIVCPEHGRFSQVARDHLRGYGCRACGLDRLSRANAGTLAEFLTMAVAVHGHRYDYSAVVYAKKDVKVTIGCRHHGLFSQTPHHHLHGQGCPACHVSAGQIAIHGAIVAAGYQDVILNDRAAIRPFELDIYVPSARLAVEFNGLYWHSYNRPEASDERNRHRSKLELADSAGISLIQIHEDEWLHRRRIVESIIINRLGKSSRVFARKLEVVAVGNASAAAFYDMAHLMGSRPARHNLGLVDGDRMLCCMSFSRHHVYDYELIRYASVPGVVVVGGASRLFGRFIALASPTSIISYSDRRYATGRMYTKLGFVLTAATKPNYCYVMGTETFSRQSFQKHKLAGKLSDFDPSLSESINMFRNGYRRLWDAGHLKFIWSR